MQPMFHVISTALTVAILSACAATPTPPESPPAAEQLRYRAAGNEPFWSVEIDEDTLVLQTPENIEGTTIPAERILDGGDIVFTQRAGGHPVFTLRLKPEPCQDTMADKVWTHSASFAHGGQTLHGCGETIQ